MTVPFTNANFTPDPAPGRILIVDDDPNVRRVVGKFLQEVGHSTDEAGDVEQGTVALARAAYDVAIIDLHMPGATGVALLQSIRDFGLPVIPILLTGTNDVATAVDGMKHGAFDFLAKPPDREIMQWAVRRALAFARTQRRERSLARVVSEWEATFDACTDLLLILSAGQILRANTAAALSAGVDRAQLVGRRVDEVFPDGVGEALRSRGQEGASDQSEVAVFDVRLKRHFLLSVSPIPGIPGQGAVVAVIRDITRMVEIEEDRKRLLRQLFTAQEDEQRKLARELHDGLGQTLTSLAVGFQSLGETVSRFYQTAQEGQEEVRRLIRGLRPAALDDLGLDTALARLAEQTTRNHNLQAAFIATGPSDGRFAPATESALYRIAQEALNNVVKHARAKTVDVVLEVDEAEIRLSVTDDGVGFASAASATGYGIVGMRERAQLLAGTLSIHSTPDKGTSVVATIPLGGVK